MSNADDYSGGRHHYMGIELNQQVWALLAKAERTDADNRRMEEFALASLFHWTQSPKFQPVNAQRGHWMISRVYATVHKAEQALLHAKRCMALTEELGLSGFDRGYADEAMARALAASGQMTEATTYYERATQAGQAIENDGDKKWFIQDLNAEPWFGLQRPTAET